MAKGCDNEPTAAAPLFIEFGSTTLPSIASAANARRNLRFECRPRLACSGSFGPISGSTDNAQAIDKAPLARAPTQQVTNAHVTSHGADITLSLFAKTALTWQVFSGASIPVITG